MKKFENIISLTKNLTLTQQIILKKQLAIAQEIKNPEIDNFLNKIDLKAAKINKEVELLNIKTDETLEETFEELMEIVKEGKMRGPL